MPRPDLTEERTKQILDAFARCVARAGVQKTSLQDVADEAGVHKSILRHYVGSRADLITALSRRTIEGYARGYEAVTEGTPTSRRLPQVLDYLFDESSEPHEAPLFDALTRYPEEYPEAAAMWMDAFDSAIHWVQEELRLAHPHSTAADRREVAAGVWSLALVADEEIPLAGMTNPALRATANRLVGTLGPRR